MADARRLPVRVGEGGSSWVVSAMGGTDVKRGRRRSRAERERERELRR
ncbi:MAG: hypothetical protein JWQ48_4040 [Conexibacter sp.]|nr:hypothetical protein [Conexibacter sp.]